MNLSESDLKKEVELLSGDSDMKDTENDAEDQTEVERLEEVDDQSGNTNEEFFKNKNESLRFISTALNESSLALDFVSLLISCVRPAAGTISMSQHLKKFVPPGSLNSDIVKKSITPQEREAQLRKEKIVGQGWKLTSLENSAQKLRDSSARLSEEVLKEKTFWDKIKKNFNNKEILYKTRDKVTGKRIFAVKYGYEDSGSTYKVQGSAVLKPTKNNQQIDFVPLNNASGGERKLLRVRVMAKQNNDDEYSIVGESKIDEKFGSDESIRSQIEKARYFIFEEELFNQLIEEANTLIAYNVKVENESKLSIKLNDEIIDIEYVEYDEGKSPSQEPFIERPENSRAELVATYLRLMLTVKYKKNLEAKKQPVVVKNSNQNRLLPSAYSLILRPLVGHFNHKQSLKKLYHLIKDISKSVPDSSFTLTKFANVSKKENEQDPFSRIFTPPLSKFSLTVNESLKIDIFLNSLDFLNQIVHVTAYQAEDLFGDDQKKVLDVDFEDYRQVEECLEWLIEEYKTEDEE